FNTDNQNALPTAYDAVYQNKAIINPVSTNFKIGSLAGSYEDNKDYITGVNNITEQEFYAVITHINILSSATIELDALSRITAISNIARAFRISVADLIELMAIWNLGTSIS